MSNRNDSTDETTRLLIEQQESANYEPRVTSQAHEDDLQNTATTRYIPPYAVLPLALLSALAMAATAATSVFTYAFLLCKDPTQCTESESHSYAGAVAVATCIANLCGILVLGGLEKLSRKNQKLHLLLWLLCRSMSVVALASGVHLRSIIVALSGRLFEGLASDNLLHFNLNSIYVQAPANHDVSRLIGSSLALYMMGIALSPFLAGLFENFETSFVIALGIFAIAVLYLSSFVRSKVSGTSSEVATGLDSQAPEVEFHLASAKMNFVQKTLYTIISPLKPFRERPITSMFGLSLLLYNMMQSYIFAAIMVHTTLRFGFTGKENGAVLSLAHSVAAIYLCITLFAIPWVVKFIQRDRHDTDDVQRSVQSKSTLNAVAAVTSLLIQAASLGLIAVATEPWHIYVATCLTALGLATPSFMKSYFVSLFQQCDGSHALAALTTMEIVGSILAPIVLGGSQALWPGTEVFIVASLIVVCSALLFMLGVALGK